MAHAEVVFDYQDKVANILQRQFPRALKAVILLARSKNLDTKAMEEFNHETQPYLLFTKLISLLLKDEFPVITAEVRSFMHKNTFKNHYNYGFLSL